MALPSSSSADATARYYDRNTRLFLKSQKSADADTIHRALYAPGVEDRHQALLYSNKLILRELLRLKPQSVLDLGCGLGATLAYLRSEYPDCRYRGITVSPVQRDLARAAELPVDLWDYHESAWFADHGKFDLVYAIESLQHASDLGKVLDNLAASCVQGGRCIVVDDFLRDSPVPRDIPVPPKHLKTVDRFKRRWHAHGYRSRGEFIRMWSDRGFNLEAEQDLSAYQRSRPWLNRILSSIYAPLDRMPAIPAYAENLLGGNALLRLQDLGLSGYYFLVFANSGLAEKGTVKSA